MKRLLIVGGGKMGTALLDGLLDASWASVGDFVIVEPSPDRAAELIRLHPGLDVRSDVCPAGGALLATKPGVIPQAARAVGEVGIERIVSIAAGVRLATIEAMVPSSCAVIRAMPNTPALIRSGATAIAAGAHADADDLAWARELLDAVGEVVVVDESKLDAVTGLSGSGPAYVFLVAEALIEAGVLNGLDRDTATLLTSQTLLGASRLLVNGETDAAGLRAAVTSPGGTTAAGLAALEKAGVRSALLDAVTAATRRSAELG